MLYFVNWDIGIYFAEFVCVQNLQIEYVQERDNNWLGFVFRLIRKKGERRWEKRFLVFLHFLD